MTLFDFPDYSFSALISIFSVIMGMAYPSIQSTIHELAKKYRSDHMIKQFERESHYIFFQTVLTVSIIMAFLSPFALYAMGNNTNYIIVWLFIHSLTVLALILATIQLYKIMTLYNTPSKLLEYLGNDDNVQGETIIAIAEIARYAAFEDNTELYSQASSKINLILARMLDNNQILPTSLYSYTSSTENESPLSRDMKAALVIFLDIHNTIGKKKSITIDDSQVMTIWFSRNGVSSGLLGIIWLNIREAIQEDNKDWFIQYWKDAVQFFSLSTRYTDRSSAVSKKFIEFHLAVGGMLIHYCRQEWINDILFYSRTKPYTFPLLPDDINQWYDYWNSFQYYGDPITFMLIQATYPMDCSSKGIDADNSILFSIEQYMALLFWRLWKVSVVLNQTGTLGLSLPMRKDGIDELEVMVYRFNRLLEVLDRMGEDTVIIADSSFGDIAKQPIVRKTIADIIDDIQKKIDSILANPVIDPDKQRLLIDSIEQRWKQEIGPFNDRDRQNCDASISRPLRLDCPVPSSFIIKDAKALSGLDSFVGNIVDFFKKREQDFWGVIFQKVKPVLSLSVDYQSVGHVLRQLCLESRYVVLYCDFNPEVYFQYSHFDEYHYEGGNHWFSQAELISLNTYSYNPFLIIMKRSDLPIAEYVMRSNTSLGMKSIPLYSNLQTCIHPSEIAKIFFEADLKVHYNSGMKYVKINLPYGMMNGKIQNIPHIGSLI